MATYSECRRFERECWVNDIRPFAASLAVTLEEPFLEDRPVEWHRELGYDFRLITGTGAAKKYELKAERRHTGNLFLETWSNKAFGRARDGWMFTCKADRLWYYFADTEDLYVMDWRALWTWAFDSNEGGGWIYRFLERQQRVNEGPNKTFGHLVPVKKLRADLGERFEHLRRTAPGVFSEYAKQAVLF